LGFAMFLKSNGSGLYATKDLALAKRKFDQFKIDKSIYVVDASQTHHFQQVFKSLELMGYSQATKCLHLAYGLVILPSGKMSSRKGNVIYFSTLVEQLNRQILIDYLSKYMEDANLADYMRGWSKEESEQAWAVVQDAREKARKANKQLEIWELKEIDEAQHAIAVATIRFGMLNHDNNKDIVFSMQQWTAKSGNTGPYMMYAYARTRSILREVPCPKDVTVDVSQLAHPTERETLTMLLNFWHTVSSAQQSNSPKVLCDYVFDLAKSFSVCYENVSIKYAETPQLQATRLAFVQAISLILRQTLLLLGIRTLDRM